MQSVNSSAKSVDRMHTVVMNLPDQEDDDYSGI